MIRSMTGFSRTVSAQQGGWVVEIRSVNHRFFEFSLKAPAPYEEYESQIRDLVHAQITRGKIMVGISKTAEEEADALELNEKLAHAYLRSIQKLKKRFKIKGEVSASDLISLPRLFSFNRIEESTEKGWALVKTLLKKALADFVHSKEREGRKMAQDIQGRLRLIEKCAAQIASDSEKRAGVYLEKLKKRLEELLEGRQLDEERLLREVALLADRTDITEETVRLKSHLELFRSKLSATKDQVGRELDFLCQEIHREINTMGAKSQLFNISKQIVQIKGEIEKIREQVQNVE